MDTFTREQQEYEVYVKVKFSGPCSSAWHSYLTRMYKFEPQTGDFDDFLVYDKDGNGNQFILSTALIRANLG